MKNNSKKLNLIFCGIAFVIMLVYLFAFGEADDLMNSLGEIKIGFLLFAVGLMVLYWFLESLSLHIITKKVDKKAKFKNTAVVSMVGQYFNCITPFASGGQPIQAFYMVKYGTPLGSAMTALLVKFIIYQFVLTAYSIFVLILKFSMFTEELAPLMLLAIVGFIVNSVVIVLMFMVALFKNGTTRFVHGLIRLLGKIRVFKNPEKKMEEMDEQLETAYENFQFVKKQPKMIIEVCLTTIVQLTAYFAISYVIYAGFGLSSMDFLTIISCQAFVMMISSFMPLPGALGAAEGSYAAYFMYIYNSNQAQMSISMVIWRFLTFYLPIIVGLTMTMLMSRNEKNKERKRMISQAATLPPDDNGKPSE